MQGHPDLAGDRALGLVDERVERPLQRGEPLPVVDQLAPPLVDPALEPGQLPFDGHVLQLHVRGDQRDRAGRLVDLAALDADQPVLHHVQPADTLGAGPVVELWIACSIETFSPSMAIGTPASKVITTSSGSRGVAGSAV